MTAHPAAEPTTQTRSQQLMSRAYGHVLAVRDADARDIDKAVYGGVCHLLPILVQTNGLCQALAFVADKASRGNARGSAFGLIQRHVAELLDVSPADQLVRRVAEAPLTTYMHQTRLVLAAWGYYKRFAVSLLDVENAQSAGDEP